MTMIYLALYKGRKTLRRPYDLIARTSDALTRVLTRGAYSHCEIALLSGSPNGCLKGTDCPNGADCLNEGAGCLTNDGHIGFTGCLKDKDSPQDAPAATEDADCRQDSCPNGADCPQDGGLPDACLNESCSTGYLKSGGTVGQSAASGRLYRCYSASIRDGGVRCKTMPLPEDKWDLIVLGDEPHLHAALHAHFAETRGQGYDWAGAVGLVLRLRHRSDRWFCSEWCGRVLGLPESWRFSPNDLAAVVRRGQMPKKAAS